MTAVVARQIAWQKAGIMKAGVPTVTCPQVECALDTLKQNAAEVRRRRVQRTSFYASNFLPS